MNDNELSIEPKKTAARAGFKEGIKNGAPNRTFLEPVPGGFETIVGDICLITKTLSESCRCGETPFGPNFVEQIALAGKRPMAKSLIWFAN